VTVGNESGMNNPLSYAKPRITTVRNERLRCVAHPRVEEYVIDFFDALMLLLPFIAADIFIQYYGRRGN
jgi:hypothetical protein